MKYTVEIKINVPRKRVIELFVNPDNMKHWQEGFVSFEPMEGIPGEVGSTAKLKYKTGKREFEMTETITIKNLPDEFSGFYETKGMKNEIRNFFVKVDDNTTKWISENEFKTTGFVKIMAFLMPGTFKKYSIKYLKDFKSFAESQL